MRWFPLAVLLGASFAAAQNAPSTMAAPDSGPKIRVEGTVLSLNGDLVRKATVRLQGTGGQPGQPPVSYIDITDNAGKFVFEDVLPGRYLLSAEKLGFVTARYGARSNTGFPMATQLTLTAGMEMKDLALKMTPQGVIAGKVVDQDGDPVVLVQVQAMRFTYIGGRKQLQPSGGTTTNDLGEYRLINLPPGRYYVNATDHRTVANFTPERRGRAGEVPEGNISTYYPNAADVSSAVAVEVTPGGEMRGTDIHLLQTKVYTVRGKTDTPSGVPPSAFLTLTRKESGNLPASLNGGGTSQLRPDGSFEFRSIIPGTYVLQLGQARSINGKPPPDVTGRVEVTVGGSNIDDLILPLVPYPEITGKVTLEDGDIATLFKPAENTPGVAFAGNAARPRPGRLMLTLNPTESGAAGGSNAQVQEDGTFRFSGVGLGKYALNFVSRPQGTYLKSARFGGQDVTKALIDTTSGTGGTLELVLSSKSAEITGSAQNDKGEAAAGVLVTLWPKVPDPGPLGGIQPALADQNGGFHLSGIAPGDYYLAAWENLDAGLALSPDFLNHFTAEASVVTLSEGGHENRDLKLVPSDKVAAEAAKPQ